MPSRIQLITGLANPGKEYADTRHNAGAWFIDEIVNQVGANLRYEAKFQGLYAQTSLHHQPCQLLIPTTFMNLSGQSVRACMRYLKIPPEEILVAHDDVDLPVGTIRLKFDGGDGGHNGLRDIIRHLNTKKFYRLRIGVGRPTHGDVVDYVLERPAKADKEKIMTAMNAVYDVLPLVMEGNIPEAMKQLHT